MRTSLVEKFKDPLILSWLALLTIAAALRLYAISRFYLMDADSAVFGLMAKHIYSLSEFPAFMWLNHYAGAWVSYIGAVFFALFGVSSWSYCLSGALLSLCWVLVTMGLGSKILDFAGFICAASIAAIPPALLLFYSLYPGGIQAETLLFCALILYLLFEYVLFETSERPWFYSLLGFFCGFGLWLSPGVLPSVLTVLTVFILKDRKIFQSVRIVKFLAGLLTGLFPLIIHNIYNPGATFLRLAGRFLNVTRASFAEGNPAGVVAQGFWQRIIAIPVSLSQIPYLLGNLLGMFNTVLFLVAGAIVLKAGYSSFISKRKIDIWFIFFIYAIWFILFYSTAVGINSPRYLLGLAVLFPFAVGQLLSFVRTRSKVLFYLLLTLILAANTLSITKLWRRSNQPRYAELASWLDRNSFYYGYSDYPTAYPVTFYSKEQVIISPTLFNASFYERYPEYSRRVRNSKKAVYIVDVRRYPYLAAQTEKRFSLYNITYRKQIFDRFVIYYELSGDPGPQALEIEDSRIKQEEGDGK